MVAFIKASTEGFRLQALAFELGENMSLTVETDSAASRGIAFRQGQCRVKHLQVGQLWIQMKAARAEITFNKFLRAENTDDSLPTTCCGSRSTARATRRRPRRDSLCRRRFLEAALPCSSIAQRWPNLVDTLGTCQI